MSGEKLRRSLRKDRKAERLGEGAHCQKCGESDLRCLGRVGQRVLCAQCRLKSRGLSEFEAHHPAGRKNDDFTIPLPANEHAILSDFQTDWPKATLTNPNGNILLQLAAWLRAIHDILLHLAGRVMSWATALEALALFLRDELGGDWWQAFQAWWEQQEP